MFQMVEIVPKSDKTKKSYIGKKAWSKQRSPIDKIIPYIIRKSFNICIEVE